MPDRMGERAVVIAGAGPVGMVLASELALAGVDFAIFDRRPAAELLESRAGGLQSRAIELLDQRGIAERFLAEGQRVQAASFASVTIDIGDFPTRHPYALGLWQKHIERILAGWLRELGIETRYGSELTGFVQGDSGVEIHLAGGRTLTAEYLVGCDGGRSLVRRLAGIEFPGSDATISHLIAEAEVTETTPKGVLQDATGVHGLQPLEDGRTVRIVTTEREIGPATEPSLDDLRAALRSAYGTDFGVHSPTSIGRFTDATRQAAAYRAGRVLLAGDSAHVHSPNGGQGLTLGFQDAVNLGWKLAQVVRRTSPDSLLDTYHEERQPAGSRALRYTMAQAAMTRVTPATDALREMVGQLCRMEEPRRVLGGLISGLDTRYDFGDGHPLLGRRMPDLDLVVGGRPARAFALMHDARPLLLNFGEVGAVLAGAWSDRVKRIDAECDGPWELPVIGTVAAPAAVLVRPDGHVAWVGDGGDAGLDPALRRWFGAAA